MAMDGYRYWVERHKLLIALDEQREQLAGKPDREREQAGVELERGFCDRLDALYGEARDQFAGKRDRN